MSSFRQRYFSRFLECLPTKKNRDKKERKNKASIESSSSTRSTPDTLRSAGDYSQTPQSEVSLKLLEYGPSQNESAVQEKKNNDAEKVKQNNLNLAPLMLPGARYIVDVFHDAEECPVRMSTNGKRLYDVVIASILDTLGVELDALVEEIGALCEVNWRFVLPLGDSRFFPTNALKELLARGVTHINPSCIEGAVENVIVDGIEKLCMDHAHDSVRDKERRIVVLLSSGVSPVLTPQHTYSDMTDILSTLSHIPRPDSFF